MKFLDSFEAPVTGKWIAVVIGFLWVLLIILLSIHLARRRSGYYNKRPLVSGIYKLFLRSIDVVLFVGSVLIAVFAVRVFSPGPLTWEIRLAFISGALAFLGILIVIRETLSSRISASKGVKKEPKGFKRVPKKEKNKT
jgi:hypothetical protein